MDGHLSTSLYCKPTDNFTVLHFSRFHTQHAKEAIPYRQALCIHRICSDEEERHEHLKILKDTLISMGCDAQLIDCHFQHATAKNRNDLLRRQTQDTTNRMPFIVQCFPGAENYTMFVTAFNKSLMTMSISPSSSLRLHF
eukprot:g23275.t1